MVVSVAHPTPGCLRDNLAFAVVTSHLASNLPAACEKVSAAATVRVFIRRLFIVHSPSVGSVLLVTRDFMPRKVRH